MYNFRIRLLYACSTTWKFIPGNLQNMVFLCWSCGLYMLVVFRAGAGVSICYNAVVTEAQGRPVIFVLHSASPVTWNIGTEHLSNTSRYQFWVSYWYIIYMYTCYSNIYTAVSNFRGKTV